MGTLSVRLYSVCILDAGKTKTSTRSRMRLMPVLLEAPISNFFSEETKAKSSRQRLRCPSNRFSSTVPPTGGYSREDPDSSWLFPLEVNLFSQVISLLRRDSVAAAVQVGSLTQFYALRFPSKFQAFLCRNPSKSLQKKMRDKAVWRFENEFLLFEIEFLLFENEFHYF